MKTYVVQWIQCHDDGKWVDVRPTDDTRRPVDLERLRTQNDDLLFRAVRRTMTEEEIPE